MAYFFQNGLVLTKSAAGACPLLCRWLVELCTRVAGMTLWDDNANTKWSATLVGGSGTLGRSVAGQPAQFDTTLDGTYTFTSANVGNYLTLTGMTPTNRNGIYRISKVISNRVVELDIKFGVHEDGIPPSSAGVSWRLWDTSSTCVPALSDWCVIRGTYPTGGNWDLRIDVNTQDYNPPKFTMGPFATWNNSSHAWSDSRNMTQWTVDSSADFGNNGVQLNMFACTDTNRIVAFMGKKSTTGQTTYLWYIGAFSSFYSASDPAPAIVWAGGTGNPGPQDPEIGACANNNVIRNSARWLAKDDLTTLQCFLELPDRNYADGLGVGLRSYYVRRWSAYSRKIYRQEIMVSYPYISWMERRGILIDFWAISHLYTRLMPFGTSREYISMPWGFAMPWNGSKVHVQPTGSN